MPAEEALKGWEGPVHYHAQFPEACLWKGTEAPTPGHKGEEVGRLHPSSPVTLVQPCQQCLSRRFLSLDQSPAWY